MFLLSFLTVRRLIASVCCASAVATVANAQLISNSNVGYIDNAIVGTQLRFRFDAAFGSNRPDRAEFLWAKCGCFRVDGTDPDAPGPAPSTPTAAGGIRETRVDYQELRLDMEYALTDRFSAFIEAPFRTLNPTVNDNAAGFGDLRAGVKYGLFARSDRSLTFQLRTYLPTGDSFRGLGTHHVSLEPALLYFQRLSDRWTLEAELRDWVPIRGSSGLGTSQPTGSFAGNILRWGLGVSWEAYSAGSLRVTPVAEVVGWTVWGGFASGSTDGTTHFVESAAGDTIVNLKTGLRISHSHRSSLYVGYGRSLTGDIWYRDIVRIDYRVTF